MGCMTSLYLNSKYPDLFAASLYVSGQWDISVLDSMKEQTFFYITSAGDTKASGGQSEVMDMFDAGGVAYTYGEWNCKDTDSGTRQSLTHMLSFNYAYKIEAVRNWLFEQTKLEYSDNGGSFLRKASPAFFSSIFSPPVNHLC